MRAKTTGTTNTFDSGRHQENTHAAKATNLLCNSFFTSKGARANVRVHFKSTKKTTFTSLQQYFVMQIKQPNDSIFYIVIKHIMKKFKTRTRKKEQDS